MFPASDPEDFLHQLFERLCDIALQRTGDSRFANRIRLTPCPRANQEHADSSRQFMHTNHLGRWVICCADATLELPRGHILGLLVHEIGHCCLLPLHHSEDEANEAGRQVTGVSVRFVGDDRLEYSRFPEGFWTRDHRKKIDKRESA